MKTYWLFGLILAAVMLAFCAPQDPEELAVQAEELFGQGLYDEGIEKYRVLLQIEPGNTKIRDKLALLLFTMGRFDDAKAEYTELARIRAQNAGFNLSGPSAAEQGVDATEKAKKEKVDEALFYQGLCALKLKQWDEAREKCAQTTDINPGWKIADLIVKTVDGIKDQTLTEACFVHFEEAVNAHIIPETVPMIPYYQKVVEECPQFRTAHMSLGIAQINSQKFDEAKVTFHTWLQQNPEDSEAHRYIAFLMARSGKLREAISEYKKAITFDPENTEAVYQLAEVYLKWKNKRQAIKYYKQYLELAPEGYYAKATKEQLTSMGVKGYE
ncbi:tetratricopeptide repeat protein [Acidobacteriota bacterium]